MTAETPNFEKMTGKAMDAFLAENQMPTPEVWNDMNVNQKRAYLAEAFTPGPAPEAPAYDITGEIALFKQRRGRMSVGRHLTLAEALGVPNPADLDFDTLWRRIRQSIERV